MSERDIDIADMQCWVFRMTQTKWNISKKTVSIFSGNITFLISSQTAMTLFI